jgi:hypothetical protein
MVTRPDSAEQSQRENQAAAFPNRHNRIRRWNESEMSLFPNGRPRQKQREDFEIRA